MQFQLSWSRVVFRPQIFWLLVAIELMLFATAVHSVAARFYRAPQATEIADPADQPATEMVVTAPAVSPACDPIVVASATDTNDPPPGALEWERTYGDYAVRCFSGGLTASNDYVESQLEIWQRDTLVYTNSGYSFDAPEDESTVATNEVDWSEHLPPPGADLTGRGQPDLIVREYSGGAHCCATYTIFELGDTFQEVAVFETQHGRVQFEDLDGNGIPVIKLQDWAYAYEFACFAASYAPDVIMRFDGNKYVIATDLMTTPPLSEEELTANLHSVHCPAF